MLPGVTGSAVAAPVLTAPSSRLAKECPVEVSRAGSAV
jgi:hypothetical protein